MPSINVFARQERHAQIDFKDGIYYKNKQENKQVLHSFLTKILIISLVFFSLHFISYQLVSAYSKSVNDNEYEPVMDFTSTEVFVLSNTGFVVKPSLQTEKGDRSTANEIIEYKIESGDTIYGIAAKFSLKAQTIIDNNDNLSKWSTLKIGQVLKILPVDGILHQVVKDESLNKIADKYKVKSEDILRQNKLSVKDSIIGKSLIIPGAKKPEVVIPKVKNGGGKSAPYKIPSNYDGPISGSYIWPANGKISQYYRSGHYALDISNRSKGPIYSMANGVVVKSQTGWNGGYGNVIVVDHGNGLQTLYAHNEKLYMQVGDSVTQGQTIAWMGNTGRVRGATGIHLHFEVIKDGIKKNPLAYIGN